MKIFTTVLLVALASSFGSGSSSASTDYWAFGDSITRGEGLGINLDHQTPGNDCTTTPNPYPSKCAYHFRLRDGLAAAGIPNTVLNRGVAGENTTMAIDRIVLAGEPLATSRCTNPNADDVLLMMEGTNDINGSVSTTTIKTNLGIMIQDATDKCVHSVLASTIRRLIGPQGTRTGDPGHVQTTDLAMKISALAGEKNRAYADVWAVLCPDQECFDMPFPPRYHLKFNNFDPGHVNYYGYNLMAPVFQAVITATPLPGAATLSSPSGDVGDSTPPFTWNEHAHSDWYFLEVDGGASYGRWHPEEAICSGGVCTFDPGVALSNGDHTWRVRTRNLRGVGGWSSALPFKAWTTLPGATAPTAPTGDGCQPTAGPYTVTYQWNEATNAKDYRLEVTETASATVVIDQTFPASANCGGGSCSATPAKTLGPGTYTWKVRATNPFGDGPWSGSTAFSRFPSTLATPTPVYPLDDIFEATSNFPPTYRWNGVAGAENYDLTVNASTTPHSAGTVCTGLACAVTGAALPVGTHSWSAKAKNRCVIGAASGAQAFDVLTCAMPKDKDLPAPGAPVNGVVDESACGELRALAGYIVGGTGVVGFHAGEAVVLGNGFEVQSGGVFTARADY